MPAGELLRLREVSFSFPKGGGLIKPPQFWIRAVDKVSLELKRGETLGLVGESGCGKTTLGHLVLRLLNPSAGTIRFDGVDITHLDQRAMRRFRPRMQMIFQDPYASLDPRMRVGAIVAESLRAVPDVPKGDRGEMAAVMLEKVGLRRRDLGRFPHEFSGGQRQRIAIARALCAKPDLVVADEPVSALDLSIQAQVINLMQSLKEDFQLSYLFISHDMNVVDHICDRIAVMYLGGIVEMAPVEAFRKVPAHPYTRALINAVPPADPRRRILPFRMAGEVPDAWAPPSGCPFHPRCPEAFEPCPKRKPGLGAIDEGHFVACWLYGASRSKSAMAYKGGES